VSHTATIRTLEAIEAEARAVLEKNDQGDWTPPSPPNGLYIHQWLWDSFFIAIGQRHFDAERAMDEVRSPFRAQWKNGMLPHIIFSDAKGYHAGPELWHCERSANAPDHIQTSGVTQPPMAAESVVRVGQKLDQAARRRWYREMYPKLVAYHEWFYRERNPRGDGLPVIFLSWETGMDNSPPWMAVMHEYATSLRMQLLKQARLGTTLARFRKDTAAVGIPEEERIATIDLYSVYDLIKSMRRRRYDSRTLLKQHKLQIVDLAVSCILIRANQLLAEIAAEIGEELPTTIQHAMRVAPHALETLWDDETGMYYNRNELTGELIKIPSVSTFLPLYCQNLEPARVDAMLRLMHDPATFGTQYPIPSAPRNSKYFKPTRYWQGPTWVNMNWLIIDGLERNGRAAEAAQLRSKTIEMIREGGMYEYFSPVTGQHAGASNFSWTAALFLDLVRQ